MHQREPSAGACCEYRTCANSIARQAREGVLCLNNAPKQTGPEVTGSVAVQLNGLQDHELPLRHDGQHRPSHMQPNAGVEADLFEVQAAGLMQEV